VLDPAPIRLFEFGHALRYDDRLAEALEVYRLGTTLNADMSLPRLWLGIWKSSIAAGQVQESIKLGDALIQGLREWPGGLPRPTHAEMESFVAGIVAGDLTRVPMNMYGLMWPEHWMLVGQPDSAIAALYRYDMQDSIPYNAGIWHPVFDSLRYGPELQALLEPRGLAGVQARRTSMAARTRPLILGNTP
ncbi:MAG: hypothetical protein OEM96_05070, partial [Gemmatimonadota bacterium]|nr:hypothetical protein [Gemmatimonadota bacterium]